MNDWLRVTAIGGDDYECRMTVRKADDTTITVTRPWHHHWTDGWDWKTIIRQWLSDVPETFEPYDGLSEWLRDADAERIDCWHCLSWLANHQRSAVESLSDAEKKRLALDGLADAVEDVRRWVMRLEKENGIMDEELGEWVERKTVRQQRRNEDDK